MLVRHFKQMSRMFMTGSDGYPALGNCARAVRFSLCAGDGSKAPFSLRKTSSSRALWHSHRAALNWLGPNLVNRDQRCIGYT